MLEWAQSILAAGEAFSGVECISLRSMLTAQSSNFFMAYHSGNLEALHSMLEKELWRRLPTLPQGNSIQKGIGPIVKKNTKSSAWASNKHVSECIMEWNGWMADCITQLKRKWMQGQIGGT